jgi:vacuolar protein sorting-associated protein 18
MALENEQGYVAAGTSQGGGEAELPIFNVQQVRMQFNIASDFVAGQVANDVLILALATGRILRIDLESPQDIDGKLPMMCSSAWY